MEEERREKGGGRTNTLNNTYLHICFFLIAYIPTNDEKDNKRFTTDSETMLDAILPAT